MSKSFSAHPSEAANQAPRAWLVQSGGMILLGALVLLTGCDAEGPQQSEVRAVSAATPGPERPGQEMELAPADTWTGPASSSTAVGLSGAFRGLDEAAMDLIRGVTRVVNVGMPDVRTTLQGLETYIEKSLPEAERLGKRLKQIKKERNRRERRAYKRVNAARFEQEVDEYRKALAEFEKNASDTEILELNGLIKKLTEPLH